MSNHFRPKVFLVCGITGAGKSTYINVATGASLPVGHGIDSETTDVEETSIPLVKIGDVYIQLVDTPGFDDSRDGSETAVLSRITKWLADSYRQGTRISGLIYLRPIHNVRVCRSEEALMRIFKHLCGEHSLDHVVLVTTRWYLPADPEDEARELELATNHRCFGSSGTKKVQTQRLKNKYSKEDAIHILKPLAQLSTITLEVQSETVNEGKSFMETSVGIQASAQIENELEQLRARIRQREEIYRNLQARLADTRRMQESQNESSGCVCA